MSQDAPADAEDHRPVPLHQGGEGGFFSVADESLQQLPVGKCARAQRAEVSQDAIEGCVGHVLAAPWRTEGSPLLVPRGGGKDMEKTRGSANRR
jgi:hypothetical protein